MADDLKRKNGRPITVAMEAVADVTPWQLRLALRHYLSYRYAQQPDCTLADIARWLDEMIVGAHELAYGLRVEDHPRTVERHGAILDAHNRMKGYLRLGG